MLAQSSVANVNVIAAQTYCFRRIDCTNAAPQSAAASSVRIPSSMAVVAHYAQH